MEREKPVYRLARREAERAGACRAPPPPVKLKENGYEFDIAFTSVLTRAIKTCNIVLEESDQLFVPQIKTWRLNERHYGKLQGLDKKQTAEKYGDEQVRIWRRSYDTLPPLLDKDDAFSAHKDRRYAHLPADVVPDGENLKVTLERVLPFWEDQIAPAILSGKRVLVAAHGNSCARWQNTSRAFPTKTSWAWKSRPTSRWCTN